MLICVLCLFFVFFFKQKTAYEMRISDWSSDVCSSDLAFGGLLRQRLQRIEHALHVLVRVEVLVVVGDGAVGRDHVGQPVGEIGAGDRKSVVEGKSVSVRVDLGGRRSIKKKKSHRIKVRPDSIQKAAM